MLINAWLYSGPAFLPSEHNELPPGVAFMVSISHFRILVLNLSQTLESHTTPISTLDFSEPYGTLVSASQQDAQPRVWDLLTGDEIGRLRGHVGAVRCLQVEDHVCLTGGEDGNVRLWDLRRVDDEEAWNRVEMVQLSDVVEEDEDDIGEFGEAKASTRVDRNSQDNESACVRLLEGHTQAVTALYFEDDCLVCVLLLTGVTMLTLRAGHWGI
jgi:division protein 1